MAKAPKPDGLDEIKYATAEDVDRATSRGLATLHLNRIWSSSANVGEQELVMMFLHLLHARAHSTDPDDVDARRKDFNDWLTIVFDGEPG